MYLSLSLSVFLLVRPCLLIKLIRCLKDLKCRHVAHQTWFPCQSGNLIIVSEWQSHLLSRLLRFCLGSLSFTQKNEIFILKPFLIFISKLFLMSWELSCWCPSSGCSAIWRRRWKMAEKFEIISTIISFSTDLHIEDDENFLFVFLWVAQPFLFWHDTIDNVY